MPATYEPIATQTLGSAAATVTFSSIPGTYTDLVLVANGFNDTGGNRALYGQFNSDTGTNYSFTKMNGDGSTTTSDRSSSLNQAVLGNFLNNATATIIQFQNYSNTTTNKVMLFRQNAPSTVIQAGIVLWRSTSAITSILLYLNSGNFSTGSTFTLYGIKAA